MALISLYSEMKEKQRKSLLIETKQILIQSDKRTIMLKRGIIHEIQNNKSIAFRSKIEDISVTF